MPVHACELIFVWWSWWLTIIWVTAQINNYTTLYNRHNYINFYTTWLPTKICQHVPIVPNSKTSKQSGLTFYNRYKQMQQEWHVLKSNSISKNKTQIHHNADHMISHCKLTKWQFSYELKKLCHDDSDIPTDSHICKLITENLDSWNTALLKVHDIKIRQTAIDVATQWTVLTDSKLVYQTWHKVRCPSNYEALENKHNI